VYRNHTIKSVANLQAPIGIGLLQYFLGRTNATRVDHVYAEQRIHLQKAKSASHTILQLSRRKDGLDDNAKSAMVKEIIQACGQGLK
jgi:hypothetical protein